MLISAKRAKTYNECKWFKDEIFSNWIIHHLSPFGNNICDVGTGSGYQIERYGRHFKTACGIEPSKSMLNLIASLNLQKNVQIVKAKAEDIPLDSNSFEIVVSQSSLHHFTDVTRALSEMSRIASKVISIIEVASNKRAAFPFLREILLKKEPHRKANTVYSENDLLKLLSKFSNDVKLLHFDQYIDIEIWVKNSDISATKQKELFNFIIDQKSSIKKEMQIHYQKNRLVMLRPMVLLIGSVI